MHLLNERVSLENLYDLKNEIHSDDRGEMVTFSHFVNRLNLGNNHCKWFYVGNKYMIVERFNYNLKIQSSDGVRDDDAVFCGVDYNAINAEWYKMFFCELEMTLENEQMSDNDDEFERLIQVFLKKFILDSERINIFQLRYMENQCAVIRIIDVTETEYDGILKAALECEQSNRLKLTRFVDYKSKELRTAYRRIYDVKERDALGDSVNRKRSFQQQQSETNDEVKSEGLSQPPIKKQRVE